MYVALSRATSVEGLRVLNLDTSRVAVHYPSRRFTEAASLASKRRSDEPIDEFYRSSHFWWRVRAPLLSLLNHAPAS